MADAPILGGAEEGQARRRAFGARFHGQLVHETVRAELNARRAGHASTKTRGEVRGGGAKPWRQKGTGRARAGSSRSPIWTGGGTVFGPQPRSYTFKVNRKERRAALRSALSVHAERGSLAILDPRRSSTRRRPSRPPSCSPAGPRAARCSSCSAPSRSSVALSFRNLERVSVLPAEGAGVADVIGASRAARQRGGARRADRPRQRQTPRRQEELTMDHTQVIIRPVVSEKSYVLAADRPLHVPRPSRRAQDADPPGRRGAVRRQRRRGPHDVGQVQAQAPRATRPGARAQWKKAIVQVRAGDTIPSSRACRASRAEPMPIRKPKPTSPGRRFSTYPDFAEITKTEPERTLVEGLKKSGGRNAHGRKTSRHRGGGAKRLYRKVDFKRRKDGVPAKVAAIEYDPNRTAYIALLHYVDGEKAYILAPQRLTVGMTVSSGAGADIAVGNCLPLREHADGHRRAQRRAPARPRRPARPLGGHRHPADGEGRRHGDAAPALRRDADGPRGVPRDRRHDRQRRSPERQGRQGRAQAPHGRAPADARHGDEPGRPPARRRRGLDDGRPASGRRRGASRRSATARARRTRHPTATSSAAVVAARARGRASESFKQEGPVGRGRA